MQRPIDRANAAGRQLRSLVRGLVLLMAAGVLAAGCGVKAMPKAPRAPLPPPVKDLSHSIQDGRVTLRWSVPVVPAGSDPLVMPAAGFRVYQAATPVEGGSCRDCPPHFIQVADVPAEGQRMRHTDTLKQKFRYVYKVVAYTDPTRGGVDSNIVTFDY
jgi:hypothetical protein